MWGRSILYALALLAVTLTSGVLIVLAGARLTYPGGYADPFAPYEAIMPGQPAMPFDACDWKQAGTSSMSREITYCEIQRDEGPIASIYATVQNARFVNTLVHARNLIVADVIRHWGQPDQIVKDDLHFYLLWDTGLYITIDPVGYVETFSYMFFVDWLTIGTIGTQPALSE